MPVPADVVERWTAWEAQHVARAERGEVTWQEQRRHRLAALFDWLALDPCTDEAWDAHFADFLTHYERAWTGYDDVARAFATWREAGVRVAVLTNGIHDQQRRKLAALGVLQDVEFVVALDHLGVGKPDPRMYAEACRRFALPPSEVVYVGDDVERDALGAAAAGLTGVWLDRVGLPVPAGVDVVVRGLDEVLPLLSTDSVAPRS